MWYRFGLSLALLWTCCPIVCWACNGRGGQSMSPPPSQVSFNSSSYSPQVLAAYQYQMAMQQAYAQEQYRRQQEQVMQEAAEKAALKQQRREIIARQKAEKDAKLQAQIAARKEANEQTIAASKSYASSSSSRTK